MRRKIYARAPRSLQEHDDEEDELHNTASLFRDEFMDQAHSNEDRGGTSNVAHLVLSFAPLQSDGSAEDCSAPHATGSSCEGGVASVAASIRALPEHEKVLYLPSLDRDSVLVQMHPRGFGVNRIVFDRLGCSAFTSTHSLMTLDEEDRDDLAYLRTQSIPLLLTNTLIPPSNPWREFTRMVHFDEETGLAVMYVEQEDLELGASSVPSALGALDYVATVNSATGCERAGTPGDNDTFGEKDDVLVGREGQRTCWVPVVVYRNADPREAPALLDAVVHSDHPPAVLLILRCSSCFPDSAYRVPQLVEQTWVANFELSSSEAHRVRITLADDIAAASMRGTPVARDVVVSIDDLDVLPSTLEGENLAMFIQDQAFLNQLVQDAIQNDPVVGTSGAMPLTRVDDWRWCMAGECPIGNLWADAIRWAAHANVAFVSSGGLRGPGWPAGNVHMTELYGAMPFSNTLCSGTMSGVSMFRLLNHSTSVATFQSTYTADGDNLLQISGARYVYNTHLNVSRLISVEVWDRDKQEYSPLERLKLYKFAAQSFLCQAFEPYSDLIGSSKIAGEVPATPIDDPRVVQPIVAEYLTRLGRPYDTSIQGRLRNDTTALTPMNFIQTEEGCTLGTYWEEHIQTCSRCPEERRVTFSESQVELKGSEAVPVHVLLSNDETYDVSVLVGDFPPWITLKEVSPESDRRIDAGWIANILPGESITIEVMANTDALEPGTALGSVSFQANHDPFPGCFGRDQDPTFDVSVRVLPEEQLNQLGSIRAVGWTLMAIIIISSLAFAMWTYSQRAKRIVRASQPMFLITICAGTLIMCSSIVPLSVDDGIVSKRGCDIACMATPWLVSMGFIVVFSALFSKIWRINKLMKSAASFRRLKVTERDVLAPFAVLFVVNLAFLLSWTILDPLRWTRIEMDSASWNTFGTCRSEGNASKIFGSLIVLTDACALVAACIQAWMARKISDEFSESKYIAIGVFSWLQVLLVGLPLIFLVQGDPTATYFLISSLIFAVCMSTLLLIFVPKIMQLRPAAAALGEGPANTLSGSTTLVESVGTDGIRIDWHEVQLKVQLDESQERIKELEQLLEQSHTPTTVPEELDNIDHVEGPANTSSSSTMLGESIGRHGIRINWHDVQSKVQLEESQERIKEFEQLEQSHTFTTVPEELDDINHV